MKALMGSDAIKVFWIIVCVAGLTETRGRAQQESPQAPVPVEKLAVSAVLKRYAINPLALDPKTAHPLPRDGKWSVSNVRPVSCPQTTETCLEVFYRVAAESVQCSWIVLLNRDSVDVKFLDENDDAEHYMTPMVSQNEAKALVNTRKKAVFPPIAIAAHVTGTVVLDVFVGKTGEVQKVAVESGPAMEQQAALDAARNWSFKPMMVGTRAVPYATQLAFTFRTTGPGFATVEMAP